MAESFTKLFSSIITSTVWSHDSDTKVVWVTMLALADKNGEVQGSVPGLARLAGVSVEACEKALGAFLAEDRYSRTQDYEGRRIEEIPGGWALLNYAKYRRMASVDDQMEKGAERARRYRANKAKQDCGEAVTDRDASRPVTPITTEAEAEAEAEADTNPCGLDRGHKQRSAGNARGARLPDDWQPSADARAFAADLGLDPDATASSFRDYWVAVVGAKGRKADWPATWRNWCRRDAERRSSAGGAGPMGQGKARRFQPARGNDAFYEQLADIARRPDD